MKVLRKIMLSLFFALAIFFSVSFTAGAEEMVSIPKWGGGVITYRNTNIEIKMPKEYIAKDSGFRAVWVTPITGDVAAFASEAQFKNEMLRVFDTLEYYKMNAMIYHVRTHHNAMYDSKINVLANGYKNHNFDEFDPLEWLIEESHRRGIEFHAWMNPYRVGAGTIDQIAKNYPKNNPASDPNNLLRGNQNIILDPGRPAVRQFLIDTVLEVIRKYDVDAIHFDDYFYEGGVDDTATRNIYNPGLSIEDFRRQQIDIFIRDLNKAISEHNKANDKFVQLGISPSGIYRNGSYVNIADYKYDDQGRLTYPRYSNTSGYAHYGSPLYSDTLKWAEEGWIDYLVPQVYWGFDQAGAPHGDIVEWWSAALKNTDCNLYIGTALYTAGSASNNGWTYDLREFANEVQYASKFDNVHGQVIFSFNQLFQSLRSGNSSYYHNMHNVKNEMWTNEVMLPEIRTMKPVKLGQVQNLKVSKTSAGYRLDFDDLEQARSYAIYRSKSPLTYSPDEIIKVIGKIAIDGKISYIDEVNPKDGYYYGVRPVSRTNTPGEVKSISTNLATDGELLKFDTLPKILVNEELYKNSVAKLTWENFKALFGGDVEYTVYTSTDGTNFSKNSFPISKSGDYYSSNIYVGNVDKIYVYMNLKNRLSNHDTDIMVINAKNNIGTITGFTVTGDVAAGGTGVFSWNRLKNDIDVEYRVQVSQGEMSWKDLPGTVIKEGDKAKLSYQFPNSYTKYSYRVIATTENGLGISNDISVDAFEKIGKIEFKINGQSIDGPVYVNQNESIEISFNKLSHPSGNVNYVLRASHNLKDWKVASLYSQQNSIRENQNGLSVNLHGSFEYYVLYVYVEASTLTSQSKSEIIELRVKPVKPITKIFMDNYFYAHEAIINRNKAFK